MCVCVRERERERQRACVTSWFCLSELMLEFAAAQEMQRNENEREEEVKKVVDQLRIGF